MSSVSYAELRDFSWAMLVLWFLWLHWSSSDISWNLVWVKMWSNGWAGDQAFLLVGTNSPTFLPYNVLSYNLPELVQVECGKSSFRGWRWRILIVLPGSVPASWTRPAPPWETSQVGMTLADFKGGINKADQINIDIPFFLKQKRVRTLF